MSIALWIIQILFAVAFVLIGLVKSTRPIAKLAEQMSWVTHYSPGFVRFIGVAELVGGLGLILPFATGIAPILTPIAAVALLVIMIGAVAYHVRQREFSALGSNIVIILGLLFIALANFAGWAA